MVIQKFAICVGVVVLCGVLYGAKAERVVSWEALEAALQDAEREALENELYNNGERDKRGPLNFRFRGAKRNAEEPVTNVQITAPAGGVDQSSESRPKRSPLSFRFRGAKRAPSSGFFGMRGKKDEWDSYYNNNNQYEDMMQEEKRGPLNFRFRGA